MSNAASRVIEKCGGFQAVAEMTETDVSRVHRWTYPKSRGGTDGVIPTRKANKLLMQAKKRRIPLKASDFFEAGDSQ